jgi:hypothetical protein
MNASKSLFFLRNITISSFASHDSAARWLRSCCVHVRVMESIHRSACMVAPERFFPRSNEPLDMTPNGETDMTRNNRASLSALLILSAACAMPLAFAQETPPTSETGAQPTQTTDAATPAPAKKSWSDLDADKNGSLSKDEASNIPSLQAVFDKADSNADGALTGEEYKTWLASNGKGQPKSDTQR